MAFEDLWIKYWWIFLIIGGLILFWFWTKLDVYTKKQITKILNKRNLLIIGCIVGWYFWHRYGEIVSVSNANRWMPLIILAIIAGTQFVEGLKYQTQQFVTPNYHGSYSKTPKYVNGFYIFAIGSFNASGISWDYAKEIAIVREETVELLPEGAVSVAGMNFVSKYELDDDVRKFIENNKFFKGAQQNIYYGFFDDIERVDFNFQQLKKMAEEKNDPKHIYNLLKKEFNVDNPDVSTLFWMYRNVCKAVGKQTEYYDATVESVEKGVEHQKRVRDAYVQKEEKSPKMESGYEEY